MFGEHKIMTTLLVTGGIGSGKTEVCRYLVTKGIPVYDSDSRAKSLYDTVPGLASRVDSALGGGFLDREGNIDRRSLAAAVFPDKSKLAVLESIIHPEVLKDFISWRDASGAELVVMESAIASGMALFTGVFDFTVLVDAPLDIRVERASRRDSSSSSDIRQRISRQVVDASCADIVIVNDGTLEQLHARTDEALEKLVYLQANNEQNKQKKNEN